MHPDGSFSSYAHIKTKSSRFKIGDNVKKGDVIALSGNVGYTSGPHLHFECFLAGFDGAKTIETKFRIDKGDKSVILKEGVTYQREY
jgi:murein DD-endopeptidase MepM/ murein hydrolase activator NlpD